MPINENAAILLVNRAVREAGVKLSDEQRTALKWEVMKRSNEGASGEQLHPLVVAAAKAKAAEDKTKADAKKQTAAGTGLTALGGKATPVTAAGAPAYQREQKKLSMAEGWKLVLDSALQTVPDPKDPIYAGDLAAYRADVAEWTKTITEAQQNARLSTQLELGILELPDGTLLDVHDPNVEQDPALASQMAAYFANQEGKVRDAYAATLNQLDLTEYAGATAATTANNATLSRNFQDQLDLHRERVSTGQANQDTAVKQISRMIQGQQENRARASSAEEQLSAAAGFGSPDGKTSFSGQDLGGGVAGLAKLAGLAPNAPLLNFTGTRQTDPLGMMAQLDAEKGVGGALPEIPGLGVDASMLPARAPQGAAVGGPPQLRRPGAPVIPSRPAPASATQGPALARPQDPMLKLAAFEADRIDQGY